MKLENRITSLDDKKLIKERFIDWRDPLNIDDVSDADASGVVYCIENLQNGRKYVGSTIDFGRRTTEYIRSAHKLPNTFVQPIKQALYFDGLKNFIVYRLWNCRDLQEMDIKESEFMHALHALEWGYNATMGTKVSSRFWNPATDDTRAKMSNSHIGMKPDAASRKKKGRPATCINMDSKEIYFVDSLKLFGEVVTKSDRSVVTRSAKKGFKVRGFYLIYSTIEFNIEQSAKMKAVYASRTGYQLNNSVPGRADEYALISEAVRFSDYVAFIDDGFKFYYLGYVDNDEGYEIVDITEQLVSGAA